MSSVVLLLFFIIAHGFIPPTTVDETGAYYVASQIGEYQYGDLHCNHSRLCSIHCLYQNSCASTTITIESAHFILKCSAMESCSSIQLNDISSNSTVILCIGSNSCMSSTMHLDKTYGAIDIDCTSTESCRNSKIYTGNYSESINVSCSGESGCQFSNWYLSHTKLIHFDCIHGDGLGASACWNIDLHAEYSDHVYLWCNDNMDCISSHLYCPTHSDNACHVTCNKEYACRSFAVVATEGYTANYLDIVEYEDNALNVVSVICYDSYGAHTASTLLLSPDATNHSIVCQCSYCCPFDEEPYFEDNHDECKQDTEDDNRDIDSDDDEDGGVAMIGIVFGTVFVSFFVIFGIVIICYKKSHERKQKMRNVAAGQQQPVQTMAPAQDVVQPAPVQYYQSQAPHNQAIVQNVVVNVPQQQQCGGVVMVQLPNGQMVAAQLMNANQEVQPQNEGAANYTVQ